MYLEETFWFYRNIYSNISLTVSKKEIYAEMAAASSFYTREYYSAALAPLQIQFVSRLPAKVKNLIRLMKYWRKTDFEVYIYNFYL